MHKPSFVMEWRVSLVQGKTLCKEREGAGGKAADPEETILSISTLSKTRLNTLNIYIFD